MTIEVPSSRYTGPRRGVNGSRMARTRTAARRTRLAHQTARNGGSRAPRSCEDSRPDSWAVDPFRQPGDHRSHRFPGPGDDLLADRGPQRTVVDPHRGALGVEPDRLGKDLPHVLGDQARARNRGVRRTRPAGARPARGAAADRGLVYCGTGCGRTAACASSSSTANARAWIASASAGELPTAVSPMRPHSPSAPSMWKTTPTCRV